MVSTGSERNPIVRYKADLGSRLVPTVTSAPMIATLAGSIPMRPREGHESDKLTISPRTKNAG